MNGRRCGMLSRRDLVGRLAAGTAMMWAAGLARTSFASARRAEPVTGSALDQEGSIQAATAATEAIVPAPEPVGDPRKAVDPQPAVVDAGPASTLGAPPPWELLRPLAKGSLVAYGWRVAGLTGVVDGTCVLTLVNPRGREHRVHLCRNDGRPQGLVHTKGLDLVVMNGGRGDLPTEEGLAQAVARLAHVLARNETKWKNRPLMAALMPQSERLRLFSGPVDRRLR